jgi:hypothetical protein
MKALPSKEEVRNKEKKEAGGCCSGDKCEVM